MPKEGVVDIKDANVLKSLFDDFYVPLCMCVQRYVSYPEAAEDIVQECFIKLWQQRGEFRYLQQVKSFLYTTARNSALNELERRKVREAYINQELEKDEQVFFRDTLIEGETYRLLTNAIERLPGQTRRVMLLALEGYDNKEIATLLEIADGTVHSLKKIAYKRLREDLKEYFYLCLPLLLSIVEK